MVRSAAVAGQFYPGHEAALRQMLADLLPTGMKKCPVLGTMSPHAGYVYSGKVAGKTLGGAIIPDRVVILGPNHHGVGHPAAVYEQGSWMTPLGEVRIAEDVTAHILDECPMTLADTSAHQYEHSLEVQVPILQYLAPDVRIAPVCISRLPLEDLLHMGEGLALAAARCAEKPLFVASSDMTHFESGAVARHKDFLAIEKILALDPEGLYDVVRSNCISMCGVMPTVVMLQALKCLGATEAELVAYNNSGDITGDQSDVVGYAGIRIF